jgi:hypothetical protein
VGLALVAQSMRASSSLRRTCKWMSAERFEELRQLQRRIIWGQSTDPYENFNQALAAEGIAKAGASPATPRTLRENSSVEVRLPRS